MKPKLKEKYCRALRSGKYPQTTGDLYYDFIPSKKGYCPLGVLYEMGYDGDWEWDEKNGWIPENSVSEEGPNYGPGFLPPHVLKKVGLTHDQQKKLAELNDEKKFTFNQIADWVEENL